METRCPAVGAPFSAGRPEAALRGARRSHRSLARCPSHPALKHAPLTWGTTARARHPHICRR
eukprot:619319-Pleurochrysis_carterae.AAC.1